MIRLLKAKQEDLWKCLGPWFLERAIWHGPLKTMWSSQGATAEDVKQRSVPHVAGRTSEEGLCHTYIISSSSSGFRRSQTTCVFMSVSPQHSTEHSRHRVYSPPSKYFTYFDVAHWFPSKHLSRVLHKTKMHRMRRRRTSWNWIPSMLEEKNA